MFPTDFEAKTSHLSLAEDGAYNRLLRLAWMTAGCSIPADRVWVYRRMRAHTEADRAVVETVIAEFFYEAEGRLSNARLSKEWLAANEAHNRRKSAGAKGGKAKALKSNESLSSNATSMLKQPEPEPEPIYTDTNVSVGHTSAQSLFPEQPKRKASPRGTARGSRIPPNWSPTPTDYAFASSEGLSREEISRETDRFRDYWTAATGRNAVKLDWEATWRNWIRSDLRRKPGPGARYTGGNGSRTDAFDRLAERLQGGADRPDAWHDDDASTESGNIIDITPARVLR
jgi:uncharacterized protein YdaU (DUF1376 family)